MSATLPSLKAAIEGARYSSQEVYESCEWVVNDLLAMGTMNVWIGPEKSRKSSMGLLLGMHMAAGLDFFGFVIPKSRRVVYLAAEDPSHEIDIRYRAMLQQFTSEQRGRIERNLTIVRGRELVNQGIRLDVVRDPEFWETFRRTYPGEVYLLDALEMFHTGSSNDDMRRTMLGLRNYCGPQNCLVILHHTRKREDREIGGQRPVLLRNVGARLWSDKALGAGAFKRLADTIICQEWVQQREGEQVTDEWTDFAAFGKSIADVPLLTFIDEDDYCYSLVRELSDAVEQSLGILKKARGPWPSKNAAAKALGISRSQANIHIRELLRKGWLREVGQSVQLV